MVSDDVNTAVPADEVDEALLDLDPNEALEVAPDDTTDTETDPENDAEHPYTHEPVEGAQPVDPAMADLVIPSAEDEIDEEESA